MKRWHSSILLCIAGMFSLNANAVVMAAQPLVGESLNAFIVGLQSSPLPANLSSFKTAQFFKQSYFRLKQDNSQYYQAYYVDANNDHKNEYILTAVSADQPKTQSHIVEVFQVVNDNLVPENFNSFVSGALNLQGPLNPCKNWYCSLANPFLFYQGGQWFMRFQNQNNNNQMCQYLWTDSQFINSPSTKGCIGAGVSTASTSTTPASTATTPLANAQ